MSQQGERRNDTWTISKLPRALRGLVRLATLNTRVDNMTGNLRTLRVRLDNSTKKVESLNKQVKTLDRQMQLQNERLVATRRELETLRARTEGFEELPPQVPKRDFKELRENWDEFGKRDPLWAILSFPEKKNDKWNVKEFFESGEKEMAGVLEYVDSLGISLSRGRALDFGCGIGRLTQALCQHFDECSGVDIAPSMIQLAEEYNNHGNRCRYYVNDSEDLGLFADNTFDFVYSNIVLQHMKPKYSKRYVEELLRVLASGGVLLFQILSKPTRVDDTLPDSAFKARITPHVSSITVEAAGQTAGRATVENSSDTTWRSLGATPNGNLHRIKLGNNWLNDSGEPLAHGDGRTNLPTDLKPTEKIDLDLVTNVPSEPGNYILELDMVQEMVTWFKDKGSETARIGVKVNGGASIGGSERLVPKIEMYGVPRQEIIDLLVSCGGRVVDVQEGFDVGLNLQENPAQDWLSFRYCATKA